MGAKVQDVSIKWDYHFTIIHARIVNVSQNRNYNFSGVGQSPSSFCVFENVIYYVTSRNVCVCF